MAFTESNTVQADEMRWLNNDPQNRKMYLMTSRSKVTNKSRIILSGGLNIPDNSVRVNSSSSGKNVTNFCIAGVVRKVYHAHDKVYSDIVIIECENVYCEKLTVKIKYEDFIDHYIKREFERQSNNTIFSADVKNSLMNALLFNYIRSVMKEEKLEIADKPGFYLKNESYSFITHKDGDEECETEAVRQAKFEMAEISEYDTDCQAIRSAIQNSRLFNMLLILDISSFMYTLLRDSGHDFNKIVAVTGCDTKEKKQILRSFFKVYERECDADLSLNMKLKELKNVVFAKKDEMIIFEDDASTKNRLSENMRFMYDCFVHRRTDGDEIAECNCMVLCGHGQTLSVLEEYSDDIIWIDVSDMCELKDCFGAVVRLKHRIRNAVIQIAETKKLLPMFFDTSEYTSEGGEDLFLSTLHMVETVCDKMLKIGIDIGSQSKKIISDISWYLRNSEQFYDENHITEQFGVVLSKAVEQGKIAFGNTDSTENFPIIYIKGELLLTSVSDFARLEQMIPFGLIDKTPKGNGIRLRSILHEKGYLVTNNGDKLLYKTSISDNSTDRMNYVAIKKNILTDKAQSIVPVVNKNTVLASGYEPPDNNDGTERILLGNEIGTGQPVYWSIGHDMLINQHLYIQADTGGGKTTALILLAQRLYNAGKNVIIFDFAEKTGYSESEIRKKDESFIRSMGKSIYEGDFTEDKFIYYSVENKRGRYEYHIYRGIDNVLHNNNDFYFSKDDFIDDMLSARRGVYILRCSPTHTAVILRDLFIYLNNNNKNRDNDIYAVLDEINSLNFDETFLIENQQSIAEVIFRQGRGIGLNLLSATQFLVNSNSRKKARLFNQSGTKLVMHLNSSSSTEVAKSISVKKYEYYKNVIGKMVRGQALVYSGIECADGRITNDMPLKISISPIEQTN